ncbi:MAG: hypothetical protein Q9160_003425 [Pyrenula sp. 1 TL-2023]
MSNQESRRLLNKGFSSDDDGSDQGYDSEAGEAVKGGRTIPTKVQSPQRLSKKRKLSRTTDNEAQSGGSNRDSGVSSTIPEEKSSNDVGQTVEHETRSFRNERQDQEQHGLPRPNRSDQQVRDESSEQSSEQTRSRKRPKPGVVYLSSLPPYLKPSALRNLFEQRGFGPINRMFLTPVATTTTSTSRRNKRQTYAEGWVEFTSKKTAKIVVETMNAQIIGGKKGGWYHDDLLNLKYLSGLQWDDLMAQFREERREEEIHREAERERAKRETRAFLEGVERGKAVEGMERKRKSKRKKEEFERDGAEADDQGSRRTWDQIEVKYHDKASKRQSDGVSDDVKQRLSRIFSQ